MFWTVVQLLGKRVALILLSLSFEIGLSITGFHAASPIHIGIERKGRRHFRARTKLSTLTKPAVPRQSQKVPLCQLSVAPSSLSCCLPATAAEFGAAGSDPGEK